MPESEGGWGDDDDYDEKIIVLRPPPRVEEKTPNHINKSSENIPKKGPLASIKRGLAHIGLH
jgi:hypothetical protein